MRRFIAIAKNSKTHARVNKYWYSFLKPNLLTESCFLKYWYFVRGYYSNFRKLPSAGLARCYTAFTLLELLVSVAIVGVLVAVALPAFGRVTGNAKSTKCAANQKQQFTAALAYAADKGTLPPSVNTGGIYFFREILPYMGCDDAKISMARAWEFPVFMCPERSLDDLTRLVAQQGGSVTYGGYVYNPFVCGIPVNGYPVKRLGQFLAPGKVWMIADGNAQASPYLAAASTIEQRIAYDHLSGNVRKAQITMLDGHSEFRTVDEMKANKDNFWGDPSIPQ